MANNPNSFYIGVPTTSVQPPISYDSPMYIQIIGSSNSVEDVSDYYGWSMTLTTSTGASSFYIVHYCNAQSSGYNSNWASNASQGKIFAHNGSGQYYNSIDSLPAGTKYWTARTDSLTGINPNAWPNDFGNDGDWGRYDVEVYLFNDALVAEEKTTITLNKAGGSGGTNTVYGTNGKYLPGITIPTRTGYSFVGYGNTSNGSETGTLYYNSSGNPKRNWTQTGGTSTLYAKWGNKITYNPHNGSCWTVNASTPGTATTTSQTVTIASSSSCASGDIITFSISSSSNISGWGITPDGKSIIVPSGVPVGTYSINITAISQSSSSVTGYMEQSITRTISITVKSGGATYSGIYITPYAYNFTASSTSGYSTPELDGYGQYYTDTTTGKVVEPGPMESSWFIPIVTDDGSDRMIPAGQITIDSSNIGNYVVEQIYGYQKITYKDGTETWVEVPLTWGGSHTFDSLGTEGTTEQVTKFGGGITFTFNGGGGDRNVVTFNLDNYLSSSDNLEGYNYPIYREANVCDWGTPSVSTTYQTKYPSGGGTIVLSKENIIISNQEGVWTSGSVSTNTSLKKLQFTQSTSASGFTHTIKNNDTANATLKNEASAASSARTGNKITIKAYGEGDKYATVYAQFSQNGPNGITITSSCPQTIYNRSGYNTCTVSVTGATGTVSYASLNISVATVNSTGVVTYVGPGTATIRVSATGNENIDSKYVDCQVNCVEDTYTCTITKPSIRQSMDLPCSGITLTTANITDYFSASATVNRTWESGYTDKTTPSSYTWTITKGTVESRGTTIDNNTRNVSINIKVTANYNSCSSQSDTVTSGRQAANPITSYSKVNAPTITQETDFPCKGVTLTTDNISTYFNISATQQVTLCSGSKININATGYTWTINNGVVASRGTTIDNNTRSVSIDISATASGGGSGTTSNSTSVTSGTQAANPISTYGAVGKPTITQTTDFPCSGVELTASNIETYFSHSSVTQSVTLCSGKTTTIAPKGYTWTITKGSIPSLSGTETNTKTSREINITVTANGDGNNSTTSDAVISGTQEANTIQSYGPLKGTLSASQEKYYTRAGGTLQASQMSTYFSTSALTQIITLKCGTRAGSVSYSWSGSNVSIPDLIGIQKDDYTARNINFTFTASGEGGVSNTLPVTSILQEKNEISSYGDVSASVTQETDFPCCGVELSTLNVETYYKKGATSQTITLQRGTRAGSVSWGNWSASGNIPSLSGTETNYATARTVSVSITASGEGSKSKTVSFTSGIQEANTIQSYGDVIVSTSQRNQFPCKGVTLTTSNISTYFDKSASQTVELKCGTRAGAINWSSWSGSSYNIPTLGNEITSTTTLRNGFSFSSTATGEGSKSATVKVTSGDQAANPIKTYGSVNTPSVSQKKNFPCKGVTLSNSNINTYFNYSATQNVELCSGSKITIDVPASGLSWAYTDATIAGWGNTYSESERTVEDFIIRLTATGSEGYTNTKQITSGTQDANPIKTYGAVGTPTIKQEKEFPCKGVTLTTSNISTYFSYSPVTQSVTLCSDGTTTIEVKEYTWSGSNVSIPSLGKTTTSGVTERKISFTITAKGGENKSATATVSKGNQAANPASDSWNDISITEYSYSNIGAGGGTSKPTITVSQKGTRTWCSGSTEGLTGTLSYSYSMETKDGFSIDTSTGDITAEDRGKNDGDAITATATVTVTGEGNKTANKKATCTQVANTHSDSWEDPTISEYSYPKISACGNETVSPTVTASQSGTRTWTSGSTEGLSYNNFTYSYSMTTGKGFSINTSTGAIKQANPRGQSTSILESNDATVTVTGFEGKTATKTTKATQSGNTYTTSWEKPVISKFSYSTIDACGGNASPSVSASQKGKRTWRCNAGTEDVTNKDFSKSYSIEAKDGFSISSSGIDIRRYPGRVTATAIGQSAEHRSAKVTLKVTGKGKSSTMTTTVTQSGNSYTDSWDAPVISDYSYPDITAAGGTSKPTITVSQNGTRTWGCKAGTSPVTNSDFTYSYSMETKDGFSIDTSTGDITAEDRGTTPGVARTATAKVIVTGGDKTKDATATCTQGANELEGITLTVGSKTISYQGTTKGTVTARYTSGSTKDVENDANTSYTANPNIVTFNKTS